jgi:hypothetical protein
VATTRSKPPEPHKQRPRKLIACGAYLLRKSSPAFKIRVSKKPALLTKIDQSIITRVLVRNI